jgi:anti-sigma-K factor RskA
MPILTAPDLRRIDLAGQPPSPRASARAFWSRSRGLVITASNLPALPAGRVYQLWFVTTGAPISAGLLAPDDRGGLTTTLQTPADLPDPVALAVTLEPEGGRPAPTGDKYLVGAAQ